MKPKDRNGSPDGLFAGLVPPGPPPEMKDRVVAAARARAAEASAADVWTRIWENRWLRLIWATSVVVLIVGHVVLEPNRPSRQAAVPELQEDEEMAEFLRTIRIAESASPNLGRALEGGHGLIESNDGGN
jgi:hypothetical protein